LVGLEDLLGFKSGLFLGVSLLSRRRLSTSPVDLAIGFGPVLSGIYSSILDEKLSQYRIYEHLKGFARQRVPWLH
jgi:hypothetical protein